MFKIIPLIYLYKRHVHCSQLGKKTSVAGMVHEQCAEGYEIVHGITHYMVFHANSGAQPACPRVRVQIPFLCFFFLTCFRFSSISCCLSFWKFACFVHCFVFRLTHHRLVQFRAQSHHCIFWSLVHLHFTQQHIAFSIFVLQILQGHIWLWFLSYTAIV